MPNFIKGRTKTTKECMIKVKNRDRQKKYAGAKNNFLVRCSAGNVTSAIIKFAKVASTFAQTVVF